VKTTATCSTDNCDKTVLARKLCRHHYMKLYRTGQIEVTPKARRAPVCQVAECNQPHKSQGYCAPHYRRWLRNGDPGPLEIQEQFSTEGSCEGPECDRPILARRLCDTHYAQRKLGKALTPIFKGQSPLGPCSVAGCTNQNNRTSGLCCGHYRRKQDGEADWDRPIQRRAPDGSGWTNDKGYRVITVDGRQRLEHRVLAAELLGRGLLPTEEIHHKNGNRSDNRTDGEFRLDAEGRLISGNLNLWSTTQPRGQEIGPKLDWVAEMIETYGGAWLPTLEAHPRKGALVDFARQLLATYGTDAEPAPPAPRQPENLPT
jgi:hypothetical protein